MTNFWDKSLTSSVKLYCGDCLQVMNDIPAESVDLILCDLPYGRTKNKWDVPIDLTLLWAHYKRIVKKTGCIALFAQSPFDKILAYKQRSALG